MSYNRQKIKNPSREYLDLGCPSPYDEAYLIEAEHPNGGLSRLFNYIKYFKDVGEWFYDNQENLSSKQKEIIHLTNEDKDK